MKGNNVIEKYKNSYWSRSDENYLLSNVSSLDYNGNCRGFKQGL
jgi:hypothetical protein